MKDWEIFEEEVAEYLDGKRQPGSGNSCMAYKKGDVKCDDYLVECKYTEGDVYSLHVDTWEKIQAEAINAYKIPLFACRSKAGDFFVGSPLDFDEVPGELNKLPKNSMKIDREGTIVLKGKYTPITLSVWKVELGED